jgi:CheY-like chemotaxis protein
MKLHSVLWIEDDAPTINGILEIFSEDKEENGYNIMPHPYESLEDFKENSDIDLSFIQMELVCIDFNLPGVVNGNEIIKIIRSYTVNSSLKIIFYSFSKNEVELQQILEATIDDISNVYFVHQDDLEDRIQLILEEA